MTGTKPGIFVSSTFFDLREHRQSLKNLIENELGATSYLFEEPAFPINPDAKTIENCRDSVNNNADILILIVGSRYGYIDKDSATSVTNIEYITARAKGIPIYVFVEATVLSYLEVWRKNPNADFSAFVDTPLLFGFVDQIRRIEGVWTQTFRNANEIVEMVRIQLAYLFHDALKMRQLLRKDEDRWMSENLTGSALRLALFKPQLWEYRLFAICLTDEIQKCEHIRREHRTGIALGFSHYVPLRDFFNWSKSRREEIKRAVDQLNHLFANDLQSAVGPPGISGNAKEIWWVARQLAHIYRSAIEWSQSIRRHHLHEALRKCVNSLSRLSDDLIESLEAFGPQCIVFIDDAIEAAAQPEPERKTRKILDLTLSVKVSQVDEYIAAVDEYCERVQSGEIDLNSDR